MGKLIGDLVGAALFFALATVCFYGAFMNDTLQVPLKIIATIFCVILFGESLRLLVWEPLPKHLKEKIELWWLRMKGDL